MVDVYDEASSGGPWQSNFRNQIVNFENYFEKDKFDQKHTNLDTHRRFPPEVITFPMVLLALHSSGRFDGVRGF